VKCGYKIERDSFMFIVVRELGKKVVINRGEI
jgi:hypothetical protein